MLNLIVALVAVFAAAQTAMPAIPQDVPADIRSLLERCSDPTPASRGDAAKKLGELGPRAAAAVPSLLAMLSDAASYMDSIKVGTMVIHGMSSPGRQAAVALGAIGGSAVEPLIKILQNRTGANRDLAALALGAAKDLRAVPPLITALQDADNTVSEKAHESLQELTGQTIARDPALWQAWWQSQKKEPQRQVDRMAVGAQAPSVTTGEIKLGSGDSRFNSIVLTNTHSRAITYDSRPPAPPPAPPVSNRCSLDQNTGGVIWKIALRGAAVPASAIAVSDENGREFVQVCWSSSGGIYQLDARGDRTGGGPQTEFLAAGPETPKQLTFKFGGTSAVVIPGK